MNFSLLSAILLCIASVTPYEYIVFIAYIPLIVYTHHSANNVFKTYLAVFFFQHLFLLYWITIPLTNFGNIHWTVSSYGLISVSLYISCHLAFAGMVAKYISQKTKISYLIIFPFSISFFGYLQDYGIILSFPWSSPAYLLTNSPIIIQSASIFGQHGLTFYIILVNSALASRKKISISILFCTTFFFIIYSGWRLENSKTKSSKNIRVAIIQSNIEQEAKNQSTCYANEIINRHLYLINKVNVKAVDLAIWPESGYPYQVQIERPKFLLKKKINTNNIISANSINSYGNNYNSVYVINKKNKIISRIDKSYLVPFGEYIPWPINLLSKKFNLPIEEFSKGNELILPIRFKDKNLGVTICYEGLSTNLNKKLSKKKTQILINISNDGWYGFSKCAQQHFNIYKIRSIETGCNYIRVSNTGISGWINYTGISYKQTNLFQQNSIKINIPIISESTLFKKVGYYFPIICGAIIISIIFLIHFPNKNKKTKNILIGLAIVVFLQASYFEKKINLEEIAQTKSIFWLIFSLIIIKKYGNNNTKNKTRHN